MKDKDGKISAPGKLNQEREWRRFELITDDPAQIIALNAILDKYDIAREELAVIVLSLRVRPGFDLKDFCI